MAGLPIVGSPYRVAVQVTDDTGALANVGAMTLVIELPDGTLTDSLSPTNSSTGVYEYDYTPTMAGRHICYWKSTGSNAGGDSTSFEAADPYREPLIQPADLTAALPDQTLTDAYAQSIVLRASARVRGHCRQEITRWTWTQRLPLDYDFSTRSWFVTLPQRPVQSVTSISVNGTVVTTAVVDNVRNRVALPDGIPTDAPEGLEDYADVTYVAGRSSVPGDVADVTLALAMRMVNNPTGITSESVTLGSYQESKSYHDDGNGFLDSELRVLRRYRSSASTARLR